MQEEGDVHVGNALSQHARKQHEEVIVNDDDIARLVGLDNLVGKLLVHTVVIGPLDTLPAAIVGLMLLVMEEGEEVMLGIVAPSGLILESNAFGGCLGLVAEPDRVCANSFVVRKAIFESFLISSRNEEALVGGWCGQASGSIDGDRGR